MYNYTYTLISQNICKRLFIQVTNLLVKNKPTINSSHAITGNHNHHKFYTAKGGR